MAVFWPKFAAFPLKSIATDFEAIYFASNQLQKLRPILMESPLLRNALTYIR